MRKILLSLTGVCIIILGAYAMNISLDEFLHHITQIKTDYILVVVAMAFINLYISTSRWAIVVQASLPEASFPKG
ncbi:MAG: hypothetical protein HQL94_08595, partial [Magnetococcales bacterium]|nr:hypothetical protein [Magnetococcales bacterium]